MPYLFGKEHGVGARVQDDGSSGGRIIGHPLEEEDKPVDRLQALQLLLVQRVNLLNLNAANAWREFKRFQQQMATPSLLWQR